MTNLFLFDVDGTLAESTQQIPKNLIKILKKISEEHIVCVVSGGSNCFSYSYSTLRINKNERK